MTLRKRYLRHHAPVLPLAPRNCFRPEVEWRIAACRFHALLRRLALCCGNVAAAHLSRWVGGL